MPSVANNRGTEWFSSVTCQICHKAVRNAHALACHLRTHVVAMRANPKATTIAASMAMFNFSSPPSSSGPSPYLHTNFQQSLLSPSSFSLFDSCNGLTTNPNQPYHPSAALSPTMTIHKPDTSFTSPLRSFNNRFAFMETPSTLYNVVPYSKDIYLHDLSDGVTRPFICQLDRPLPVIIELDSDGEDNEVHNEEILDLSLKL